MKKPAVIANWKMNGSCDFVTNYFANFNYEAEGVDVVFMIPFVYLPIARENIPSFVSIGAQNISQYQEGAFTGEISGSMLKDFQCNHVLVGHSERRSLYLEDNVAVADKFFAACDTSIIPILCVGESLKDRESDDAFRVIKSQCLAILQHEKFLPELDFLIAYEPVWAIGTGKVATADEVQEIHSFIRGLLDEVDSDLASRTRILYGGSLKPENAFEIFNCNDVNGGLVGGASLKPDDFKEVIDICNKSCC